LVTDENTLNWRIEMKNIFMIAAMTLISYAPYTAEAAEALMWKSALDSCKSNDPTSNGLPVKISELSRTEQAYVVTVSAQFLDGSHE